MRVDLFDFDLPAEAIAQHAVEPRDAARLLVVGDTFTDRFVRDLPECLAPGDCLVFNDTRVIPTRLFGSRDAVKVEATLIKPLSADCWRAYAKPGKRLKPGQDIRFDGDLTARVLDKEEDGAVNLRFDRGGADLMSALEAHGAMPLPPYIKRGTGGEAADLARYQTVYAARPGAVAAPTAGLHFTDDLLRRLAERGVRRATLTLHVGAGTFLPVKAADTDDHVMHAEWGEIDETAATVIGTTKREGGRIIAVGTTVLRLLESAATEAGDLHPFIGETDIFITPGYRFRLIDRLMTNFHLPKSTLFMLVAAFAGLERMKAAYAHAVTEGYRFYSYGDSSLLTRQEPRS
ncbi:MAG: tRNA preQ1(34) S-adenosylmethionine ribosyltransferase-isomerase QueA [Rhodospirillales bacterium]